MYRIILGPRASKDLSRLERPIKRMIDRALFNLQQKPRGPLIKFLKDRRLANFRIRVGDYRILYDLYEKDKIIYVLRIGHRKEIYR